MELWKSISGNAPNDLGLLNEQDNVDGAIQWLLHGKIDAKHLAKSLPHTAQDLRDGKTSSDQLFQSLKRILNGTLKVRGKDGFEGSQMEFIAHRLSSKTIPDWWCRNGEQKQWLEKAHAEFARDFFLLCESMDQLFADSEFFAYKDIAPPIHAALRETCEEWAQRVDETIFRGKQEGTFLFMCTTYALTHDESMAMVRDLFQESCGDKFWEDKERIDLKKKQLEEALDVVVLGALEPFKSCWECEATSAVNDQFRCSKCKVARYCNRHCQRNAWKGGHKQKCKMLEEKNIAFLESLDTVDRAHETGTLEGTRLNYYLDYNFASQIFTQPLPPYSRFRVASNDASTDLFVSPQGPSMKFFYENLGRVLRGEWWFYRSTDSLEAYTAKHRSDGSSYYLSSKVDWLYFVDLFHCLCYDIFGCVAEFAGESDSDREQLMNFLVENSVATAAKDTMGAAMPSERFIELYKRLSKSGECGLHVRNRLKSNKKAETLKFFRDNLHK